MFNSYWKMVTFWYNEILYHLNTVLCPIKVNNWTYRAYFLLLPLRLTLCYFQLFTLFAISEWFSCICQFFLFLFLCLYFTLISESTYNTKWGFKAANALISALNQLFFISLDIISTFFAGPKKPCEFCRI